MKSFLQGSSNFGTFLNNSGHFLTSFPFMILGILKKLSIVEPNGEDFPQNIKIKHKNWSPQ